MTAEQQTPPPRRKRGASKRTKSCSTLPLLDAYGKNCPAPGIGYPAYMHFRLRDGTEVFHSNEAIARAGRCPHCFVDRLGELGFFHSYKDETFVCRFDFDGDGRDGRGLLAVLTGLGLPLVNPLNLFDNGGQA